ncbi:MAG: cysteine desulfurase family protein [Actinomycetia bacterium]|nr:cysteine desulfurase family protein [Actinomycetes bacterium]
MPYLDHAATTPMRPEAVEAMLPFLTESFGNPSGAHRYAQSAKTALENARETVARVMGAEPDEVVFTGSGTEGDNLAVEGAARAARAQDPHCDRVLVSAFEHKAVLAAAHRLEAEGFRVTTIPVGSDGIVDLAALADALDERVAVVSLMLVNNEVGTIQPVAAVAELLPERAPRAVLHTDAVQAVPWIDVARATARVALVSISGHKFGGPKGRGVLVVRRGTPIVPMIEGGGQEYGLRSGTQDVAGSVALATAIDVTAQRLPAEVAAATALRDRLYAGLADAVPGLVVNGDPARKVAGNLHVGIPGIESEALLVVLDRMGLAAAAGSSCSSGATEPSYVLRAMGVDPSTAIGSIRLSLGYSSVPADVDAALEMIPAAVAQLRRAAA